MALIHHRGNRPREMAHLPKVNGARSFQQRGRSQEDVGVGESGPVLVQELPCVPSLLFEAEAICCRTTVAEERVTMQ